MAATKQTIAVLLGYLTCDDPVIKTKYENILVSFFHKDDGLIITNKAADGNGGTNITFSDASVLNIPELPNSKPIAFITGLVDALALKVDKAVGKQLSEEDFTTALKNKLNSLANYVHPDLHLISEVQDLQAELDNRVTKIAGKGLSTEDYTTSEKNKLASIDATHYLPPLQTTVELSALPEANISDKARVYIEDELTDYFYDATAVSGDIAPDDQTVGTGFWRKVAVGGETAASIKTKYESNADTNAFTDAEKTALVGKADKLNVLEKDNVTPFTPTADYHPVTKKYMEENAPAGSSIPVSKTGTTIVFTEDALYNEITPLTSGNLTLDLTGAVKGAVSIVYCDRYVPTISGENYQITGFIDSNKLSQLWFFYNGTNISLIVVPKTYISTPSFTVLPSHLKNTLLNYGVANASNYEILFSTTNDIGTASAVPAYDGTSTTYIHTGLTNGIEYFYWIKAFGNGYIDGDYGIGSGIPALGNTLLGGLASTYPSSASVETLLGLSVGDITNYEIYNTTDITCDISVDYTLPNAIFQNNSDITFFEDRGGKCTSITSSDHFNTCANLVHVIMNGVMPTSPQIRSCDLLQYAEFPNANGIIGGIRTSAIATRLYHPLGTSISSYGYNNSPNLKYIPSTANLTTLSSYTFSGANSIEYLNLNNVSNMAVTSILNTMIGNLVVENEIVTSIISPITRFSTGIKKFIFSELITHQLSPNNGGSPKHYVISKATTIGAGADYSVVSNNFIAWSNPAGGGKIYVHNSMATINGGSPSADMDYLTGAGFTVIYVTDYTAPSAVADLSASGITSNSVDLNFSIPSSLNTIQHYDVYLDMADDRGYVQINGNEITVTGDTISGLPSGTQIKVKVRTIDEFYNRSGFSNEVIFNTL